MKVLIHTVAWTLSLPKVVNKSSLYSTLLVLDKAFNFDKYQDTDLHEDGYITGELQFESMTINLYTCRA